MDSKKNKNNNKNAGLRQAVQAFSILGGIGFYLVAVIGICIFLGNKADECFNIGPYGKVIGILLGFPIGIYSIYKKIRGNM